MKSLLPITGLFIIVFTFSQISHTAAETKNVVLVSIDGLRPEFYKNSKYGATHMIDLAKKGASATSVLPVYPSLTYPNHTSIITGLYTRHHGVLSNTIFDFIQGPTPAWYWEADHIKALTLFDLVKMNGLTSASVRWPVTLHSKTITHNVPEIFGMQGYYEGDSFDLTVKYTDKKLINHILKVTTHKRYDNEVEMDLWVTEATNYILESRKPDFTALHLANLDHVEHGEGRESEKVIEAVKEVDNNIRMLTEKMDFNKTCLVITGDHGFKDVSHRIQVNLLFIDKGWITLNKDGSVKSWDVIAHASGAQAGIYVKDKKMIRKVRYLLKKHQNLGYRLIGKREINRLGAYPDAALAVEGNDGFTISGSMKGTEIVVPSGRLKANHGYTPMHIEVHTGLIMLGCGERKGQKLGVRSLVDVAPTISRVLKLKEHQFDGKAISLNYSK